MPSCYIYTTIYCILLMFQTHLTKGDISFFPVFPCLTRSLNLLNWQTRKKKIYIYLYIMLSKTLLILYYISNIYIYIYICYLINIYTDIILAPPAREADPSHSQNAFPPHMHRVGLYIYVCENVSQIHWSPPVPFSTWQLRQVISIFDTWHELD